MRKKDEGYGKLHLTATVSCLTCHSIKHFLAAAGIKNRSGFEKDLRKEGWRRNKKGCWVCWLCLLKVKGETEFRAVRKRLEPHVRAVRESTHITGEDLSVIVR